MKKLSFYPFALLLLLLFGCSSDFEFTLISSFTFDSTALEDGEEIKVIYFSDGPDYNQDHTYYYHYIVVSQKTGKTINILSTDNIGVTPKNKDKVYNFFSVSSEYTKLIKLDDSARKHVKNINELENFEPKKLRNVVRNLNYPELNYQSYPTVIGIIGFMMNDINPKDIDVEELLN